MRYLTGRVPASNAPIPAAKGFGRFARLSLSPRLALLLCFALIQIGKGQQAESLSGSSSSASPGTTLPAMSAPTETRTSMWLGTRAAPYSVRHLSTERGMRSSGSTTAMVDNSERPRLIRPLRSRLCVDVYVGGLTSGALPGQVNAGTIPGSMPSGADAFVRKYDFNANELWTRQFGDVMSWRLSMRAGSVDSSRAALYEPVLPANAATRRRAAACRSGAAR